MGFADGKLKKPELKKISDVVWEVPTTFKQGMRVPIRIYANQNLINAMDLEVFDQAANAAMLPGLLKYSYVFSDGHSGYGVPVGWCGAFDLKEGIISPGAVGFDINCLDPETRVTLSNGCWIKIKDLEREWQKHNLILLEQSKFNLKDSNLLCFMRRKEEEFLYEIITESGRKIRATGDHPVLTEKGMCNVADLNGDENLFVYPFSGVEYEQPSDEIIIDKEKIESVLDTIEMTNKGNARGQIIKKLEKLGLLEIKYSSPKLPILLKLVGFIFGDGSISFIKGRRGIVNFYANEEDLKEIKSDILKLGFGCSNIYKRNRKHKIKTYYGFQEFAFEETSITKMSTSFAVLLVALGTPYGKKTSKKYRVPEWILKAPLWQKRLFLSAFFGAELSKPKTVNNYDFYQPQLNMNKLERLKDNGVDFLNDIRLLLLEFGVTSSYPTVVDGYQYLSKEGKTCGLRISIHSNSENLIKLFEKINFEYNKRKKQEACLAANYIRIKESVKKQRYQLRKAVRQLYEDGVIAKSLINIFSSEYASEDFIKKSLWEKGKDNPRTPFNFISFETYKKTHSVGSDGIVKDKIKMIKKIPYKGYVYDVTVNDPNHNWVANSFVVSNCGVRLIKTNLTLEQVKPKMKEITDLMFKMIPAGVGATAYQEPKEISNMPEGKFREAIEEGAKWALNNGYAWKEDIERIEERGKIEGADFSKVSREAYKRGKSQLGTLGSGNHYLEIQAIDKIFDEKTANHWGLDVVDKQICIMVHCGSRGFGHQICTDYLSIFVNSMKKFNIKVPDQQLAYAPFNSEEGQSYFKAMSCAINFAFLNRQLITYQIRKAFEKIFGKSAEDLGMDIIYDVAHNTAKVEEHKVNGERKKVIIHRKGATRCLGPDNKELTPLYQKTGQPVIIGGSMETGSFLCVGTRQAEEETFGTTLHGSGRTMSRAKAKQMFRGEVLQKHMMEKGIYVKATTMSGLAEEAGNAYKDINEVVESMHRAEISLKVLKLNPLANIKG